MILSIAMLIQLGCEPYPVYGKKGNILYYNQTPDCVQQIQSTPNKPVSGGGKPTDPVRPEPPTQEDKTKGNASANNGKGGNYDKTGHEDNGKGNGRR